VAHRPRWLALFHASLWQAFVMMVVLGVGIGSTSAAIPGLIVRAVPDNETGSAMGFYQVVRYVGFSLGSALTASIIASHTPSGQHLPTETAYTLTLWIAVVVCIAAAAVAWIIPARGGTPPNPIDKELVEEDAELGPAGFIGLTPAPGRGEVPSPTLDTRAATLLRRAGPPRDFLSSFTKRRFGRDNRGTEAQVAHAGH
jgi:MFS family permease